MSDNELLNEEEWLKNTVELDSAVSDLAQELEENSLELEKKEEKYRKLEEDDTFKETGWLIGENSLRGKLRQMEEKKLRIKLESEEKFKGVYQELRRCTAHSNILQKEAEIAKDELRKAVFQVLQLEKAQENAAEKELDEEIETNAKIEEIFKNLENMKEDVSMLKQNIEDLDILSLTGVNMRRLKEMKCLQENNEMLLIQIEELQKENKVLSEKDNTDEGPSEKDLIMAQLQQEIFDMSRELTEISDEKLSLEKQLEY